MIVIFTFSWSYPGREEWLFSMGSIFCVETIRKLSDTLSLVLLRMVSDTDPELIQLTEHIRQEITHDGGSPMDRLHRLVQELCLYDENAQQFFERVTTSNVET